MRWTHDETHSGKKETADSRPRSEDASQAWMNTYSWPRGLLQKSKKTLLSDDRVMVLRLDASIRGMLHEEMIPVVMRGYVYNTPKSYFCDIIVEG